MCQEAWDEAMLKMRTKRDPTPATPSANWKQGKEQEELVCLEVTLMPQAIMDKRRLEVRFDLMLNGHGSGTGRPLHLTLSHCRSNLHNAPRARGGTRY